MQIRNPNALTPAEQRVLELMLDGSQDKEIAVSMDVSPNTVGVHVAAILRKMGAKNRTQAVAMYLAPERFRSL